MPGHRQTTVAPGGSSSQPCLSFEGLHASTKEIRMSRNATYLRFALLLLVMVALAVFMGDPWGPI
jgi:hypothetical protein